MKSPFKNQRGFTIIELLVSTMILGILIITAGGIYFNFYRSFQNIKAANLVYDEARFIMERIVKEVRKGTIDYEEYYNQARYFKGGAKSINQTYGQNYCRYSQQFYDFGRDGQPDTYDDISLGKRQSSIAPLKNKIQNKLFLIESSGQKRSYVQLVNDQGVGKVGLLQLVGKDWGLDKIDSTSKGQLIGCEKDVGEGDGLIDTWVCEKGFNCPEKKLLISGCQAQIHTIVDDPSDLSKSSFLDITPSSLDVVDLKFFISPSDDPRKAYNDPLVQIQPHVTIKLVVRANPKLTRSYLGNPEIVLESTVSARAQAEVITACNQRECNELPTPSTKACAKVGDVVSGTVSSCKQGVYPICDSTLYEKKAQENMKAFYAKNPDPNVKNGLDYYPPFNGKSFYEPDTELGSCVGANAEACKRRRCSDGHDNDGNGFVDSLDPACNFHICHNGVRDFVIENGQKKFIEDCIDVGGICSFRAKQSIENLCFDGYDNDCNGQADEFDQNCIDSICSNGVKDPTVGNQFVHPDGLKPQLNNQPPLFAQNYLVGAQTDSKSALNELSVDVGGLCEKATKSKKLVSKENSDDLCADGLDNDKDGKADELDGDCQQVICENGKRDTDLVDSHYSPADYLGGYSDDLNLKTTDLDETVTDIGGLCGYKKSASESTSSSGCFDKQDNDADGLIDQMDPDCCIDFDKDGLFPTLFKGANFICAPKNAQIAGAPGQIDCNDADKSIGPGEAEICDDATYANDPKNIFKRAGYEIDLRGKPIDNNCSGANLLTPGDSGWDHDDPLCCVDNDADGFGESSHYLYQKNGRCTGLVQPPKGLSLTKRTPYDCDDKNKAIHPGVIENTLSLCKDGVNNNCSINQSGQSRMDHIDLFAKTIGIKKAFDDQLFEPECCTLSGLNYASGIEICDDDPNKNPFVNGVSSDENCNGLEGDADHQCLTSDGLTFKDQFTSNELKVSSYIDSTSTTAAYSSGTFTIKPGVLNAKVASVDLPVSPSCKNIVGIKLQPTFSPANANITYEVSNLGFKAGSKESYQSIGQVYTFVGKGTQLRWRAILNRTGGVSPELKKMEVSYICN